MPTKQQAFKHLRDAQTSTPSVSSAKVLTPMRLVRWVLLCLISAVVFTTVRSSSVRLSVVAVAIFALLRLIDDLGRSVNQRGAMGHSPARQHRRRNVA